MKSTACVILALLAIAFVAQSTEAAFCRTSSYKVNAKLAEDNKKGMYGACKSAVKILKVETKPDGCVLVKQQVASKAAWDAYSACEKSAANVKLYSPLKAQAGPCEKYATKGDC